ncbi:tetratricopeptide repeat-containing glycosyltransferase family protein [Paraburkholderia sp. D15]|uniref:tetratricopeptide repeat-containing glycosyltransferase family protein n=1 Tax=Paraburkholderia sp. D15 TaxID=2880218 RepID=UPI002479D78B|nr:tetratricopeptide repeat-containing glycosyltransferase family protein [Paraburkholderia sp. D15]WGS54073.1 tetratricopeptide repeat-containing glycosyltransferase family protein [Paraburkholderia sp. D15]
MQAQAQAQAQALIQPLTQPDPSARFTEALDKIRPLLDQTPPLPPNELAEALQLAAVSALGLGQLADAESYWRRAIDTNPHFADAYLNLVTLLKGLGRLSDVEALLRQLLDVRPELADVHNQLGSLLQDQGRMAQAEAAYAEASRLSPERLEFHYNLGTVLRPLGRWREAADAYRRPIGLRPDFVMGYSNLGNILKELGQLSDAEAAYRQALAISGDYYMASFALATLLLSMGRFDEGWRLHDERHAEPGSIQQKTQKVVGRPRWQGEPLAGKTLMVWQEGGLGDAIHFGRYLPMLKAQGAARVAFVCSASLHRLFASVEGVDAVLTHEAGWAAASNYDYWTSPLSAPFHLRTTVDTIPPPARFTLDPALVDRWRERLAALPAGRRIGLVWKGNALHRNDANRSLGALTQLAPLWRVPGVNFISLQKGDGEDEAQTPPVDQPLLHLGSDIADLADSAAIIAQLDLVICVDTVTAHLAASLGIPCWVMLPEQAVDWRWMHERSDSPWYPGTIRLFRQPLGGRWSASIERVRQACLERFPRA